MNSQKLRHLAAEIVVWGNRNFGDKKDSAIGVAEEGGELAHCILKRIQGIRGFDNPTYFKEQAGDALADTCVYLLHLCGDKGFELEAPDIVSGTVRTLLAECMKAASRLLDTDSLEHAQGVLDMTASMAVALEIDLEAVLDTTWASVMQRDWLANPVSAHAQQS